MRDRRDGTPERAGAAGTDPGPGQRRDRPVHAARAGRAEGFATGPEAPAGDRSQRQLEPFAGERPQARCVGPVLKRRADPGSSQAASSAQCSGSASRTVKVRPSPVPSSFAKRRPGTRPRWRRSSAIRRAAPGTAAGRTPHTVSVTSGGTFLSAAGDATPACPARRSRRRRGGGPDGLVDELDGARGRVPHRARGRSAAAPPSAPGRRGLAVLVLGRGEDPVVVAEDDADRDPHLGPRSKVRAGSLRSSPRRRWTGAHGVHHATGETGSSAAGSALPEEKVTRRTTAFAARDLAQAAGEPGGSAVRVQHGVRFAGQRAQAGRGQARSRWRLHRPRRARGRSSRPGSCRPRAGGSTPSRASTAPAGRRARGSRRPLPAGSGAEAPWPGRSTAITW